MEMSKISQEKTGLTLQFEFLAGRYHATKWGRNVNEGLIDWPPSPWRILRAIISSWKIYHSDIENSKMEPILKQMCSSKISFKIPNAIQSHTRHFMPIKNTTEMVIDSFIMVNKDEYLYVNWHDLDLKSEQKEILAKVIDTIKYLGRAESWCHVKITEENITSNCTPLEDGRTNDNDNIITMIIPTPDATLENLCVNIKDMYKAKKSHPDGSQFVQYIRQADCLTLMQHTPKPNNAQINIVRYVIAGNVRPKITDTIIVGDIIKRAVMSLYGKKNDGKLSETFSGKDSNKQKLSGHTHAYYLPTDEDKDGILDHITILSKKFFNEKELEALNIMKMIRSQSQWFDLVYQARGKITDFEQIPILRSSKKWESVTPFVLNRHMSLRGSENDRHVKDGPEDQLSDEIRKRFEGKIKIKSLKISDAKSKMRSGIMPIQFKRWRKSKLPGFGAYNVQIEFEESIPGPLSFGHGSHFGLGLLAPCD